MLCHKYMGVLAMLAAMAAYSAEAALDTGVCYSPWHHASVTDTVVQTDLSQIKEYFTSFRSYHAQFSGINVIEQAATAGLKVAVGIQMSDASAIETEITAACTGAVAHPSAVDAIFVGNENMVNGDFGTYTAAQLVEYIQRIKTCTSGTGIKVGSVQRMNEWTSASDAATLAAACDIVGVNIYPFFTEGTTTPIEKLEAQWSEITTQYSGQDVWLTETGWPREGSAYSGNTPSQATTQSFLDDFVTWATSHSNSYYFMMYDTTVSYSGADYEKYFGLADTTGTLQVTIPTGSATNSATTSTSTSTTGSSSTTPAATTATPASTTATPSADEGDYSSNASIGGEGDYTSASGSSPAATPAATEAATATPEATPASTTATPEATTATPEATTATPEATTATPEATTATPEATTATPAATPAATTTTPAATTGTTTGKVKMCDV